MKQIGWFHSLSKTGSKWNQNFEKQLETNRIIWSSKTNTIWFVDPKSRNSLSSQGDSTIFHNDSSLKQLFSHLTQIWQISSFLRHPVNILVTVFTEPDDLPNDLLILKLLILFLGYFAQRVCVCVFSSFKFSSLNTS